MPRPRKHLISLDATPYYHCVSRCVRRAFLCGYDEFTKTSYEHRRLEIEERNHTLADIFAIDVAAYAVMSNYTHLVLHINSVDIAAWSDLEICERWHSFHKGTALTQKYAKQEPLDSTQMEAVKIRLGEWRLRLGSISWFMASLNEATARKANLEDKCTGKFWEARFKSQALLDEKALAACMAYVDLNPIRAKMDTTPETSEHTSIKKRIDELKNSGNQPKNLMDFVGNPREPMPHGLPFNLKDYINLVDWSGRIIREGKRGAISNDYPPILDRINIDPEKWLNLTSQFMSLQKGLAGEANEVRRVAEIMGYQRTPGLSASQAAF